MRKVKDAKDLSNNELIYFKGHAKATYMSDGTTVEDAINDIKNNSSGNSDLSDYETKAESQNKLQEAKNYTDSKISELQENVVTQTIQLNLGWNWVSFYVETSLEKLQNALGNNGIEIKHMDFTTSYDEESGLWLPGDNPLTSIEPSKMYMINTNSDCVIELEGRLLKDIEITLNPGLNWIAYPLNVSMDVTMALINLEATEGDQIKNADIYTNYYESYNVWYGGLNTFEPGQGYIYTNNSSETKTFKYPTELDIKLLEYETKEDAIAKLEEAKEYTDIKTDELRDVVTQTLSLSASNNWCSFYVDITLEQLQQALGANATSIITSFDGSTEITSSYDADTNTWSGDLTTLDVTKMYKIYINTDCEISLTGRKIPNSIRYILNPGWNWISFPMNTNISVAGAFEEFEAQAGDRINSKGSGYSEYYEGYGWFGALTTLQPGQGYMYNNTSTESKTLVFTTELIDTKSELNKKQDVLVSGTNIKTVNGESLLGEGNIVISGGSSSSGGAYALVEHDTNDTTYTLTPNTFHVWGEVASLTLTLGSEQSGVSNEYLFQFESGATATTLTLPDNLIWANDDIPVIESNYTYQVSILKGFATLMKFVKPIILISFTIGSETFQAEKGMTWSGFVYSKYNPYVENVVSQRQKFTLDGNIVKCFSNNWMMYDTLYYNNNDVLKTELIIDNGVYQINESSMPPLSTL